MRFWIFAAITVFFVPVAEGQTPAPVRSPPGGPAVVRRSLGYWPTGLEDQDLAFARLQPAANMAYIQKLAFDTDPIRESRHAAWLSRARNEGMALFIALEIFAGSDRSSLRVPPGWTGPAPAATDSGWRQAWRQICVELAQGWQPEYLCVAVEANMYRAAQPGEWEAFRFAFDVVRQSVHAVAPHTRVFASYQLEYLHGAANQGLPQWDLFDPQNVLDQDVLGISSYPVYFAPGFDPALIPSDHFRVLAQHSTLPVFVAETGWHSFSSGTVAGSEAIQAGLVRRLRTLLSGLDLEGYCWVSLMDPPPMKAASAFVQTHPTLATLGLNHGNGTPKMGWGDWVALDGAFPPPGTLDLVMSGASLLTVSGSLAPGSLLTIEVQGALPLAPSGLGISAAPGASFFSYGPLGGFTLGLAEPFTGVLLGSTDAAGHSLHAAQIPASWANPFAPAGTLHFQAVAVDLALQPHPHVICTLSNVAVVPTGG